MQITAEDALNGMNGKEETSIFAERRDKLRVLLRLRGLDALLVSSAPNRFYLSGFELHDPQPDESAGMLLISAWGSDWLATDSRYALAAEELWPDSNIFIYGSATAKDIGRLIADNSLLCGIEAKAVSWQFASQLEAFFPSGHALVRADGLVEKLRIIKDKGEQRALKASFALNHQMYEWLEREFVIKNEREISEKEMAWEIEKFFREKGAQELAFSTIVASGSSSALPHAIPALKKIKNNTPLLVDSGCRVDNYCSDQTRSWWKGNSPASEFEKALALVKDAQKAAIDFMRPGVACAEVYQKARKIFEKAGVEKAFTHGLGHGVGLQTHEAPSLSPRSTQILEEGMAVTVEPGLYYREWGGIRWENTVLIVPDGIEIL